VSADIPSHHPRCLPAAAAGASWCSFRIGQRSRGVYCAGTAITMPTAMALATAGFSQSPRLVVWADCSSAPAS
jgi:hypothetical protein